MKKNNPRLINAWSSYDWANSVYNLIVTTAIFPSYYESVTKAAFGGEMVSFFGINISSAVLFTYAISFSFLIIVVSSPILSGIADYTGSKKRFMQFFTYLGSLSCMGLYFFEGPNIEYGIACSVLASVGYAGSLVFYNGFLPEIATSDRMDSISAKGFTFGYIGSVILLSINLALIMNPTVLGFGDVGAATKFGFLLVGLWWMGFAQIAFYYLKDRPTDNKMSSKVLGRGLGELKKVWAQIKARTTMKRYLLSFFFYSMGVLTVMLLAPLFASKEVGVTTIEMILVVLILQILAIFGAYFFAWLSNKKGSRFTIGSILIIWVMICIICYFLTLKIGFYILAGVLGFGMGGVQSISRSTYSRLIPKSTKDTASYFSFFDITEKLAIVIGTFAFGFINQLTGSMRNSMLFMTLFFVVGFIILQQTNLEADMKKIAEEDFDNPWDDVLEDVLD
ncbi:MFS transporter [Aureispira anguillae]|uniref:MFS transporter n=1 Tax=Aureispira anguillae TaxID=2864201 RepID=A0A916DTC5_9BACT|nr:MFS transporter [Aureispira anguillae]BDS11667.1 MFS transporter [Aureispira anguillae]